MPKNVAIGLGALIVLAVLMLVFMGSGTTTPVSEVDTQAAAVQEGIGQSGANAAETNGIFESSFAELMQRGGSFECAFNETVQGSNSSGVVYVSGEKVRLNFSSSLPDAAEPTRGAMIQKENTLYMWSDAMPQGIKMAVPEGQSVTDAPMSGGMFDQNMKMKYDCKSWTPNNAWFEVPPTIEFMSL